MRQGLSARERGLAAGNEERSEAFSLEARAANERTVDVRAGQKLIDILRRDAAPVKYERAGRSFSSCDRIQEI